MFVVLGGREGVCLGVTLDNILKDGFTAAALLCMT